VSAPTKPDTRRIARRLVSLILPYWPLLLLVLALLAIVTALDVAIPYLFKVAIDSHIAVNQRDGLYSIALLFALFTVGKGLGGLALGYTFSLLGQRALHDLRCRLHAHLLTRSASFYDRTPVGRLHTAILGDVEAVSSVVTGELVTVIADLIVMIAVMSAMLTLSVPLTLITMGIAAVLVPMFWWSANRLRSHMRNVRSTMADLASYIFERLAGVVTVQTLRREATAIGQHGKKTVALRKVTLAANNMWISPHVVAENASVVAVAVILWFCAPRMDEGLTLGLVVAFIEYSRRVFEPINSLAGKFSSFQGALAAAERIFTLLDTTDADAPARPAPAASTPPAPAATNADPSHAVEFRDIQFGYQPDHPILHGVTLNVPRGSTIAVVGATGSGKSTLVRLLARHYQPQGGAILLDGRDVRDVPISELRRRVTLIAQDVFLFSGTIADTVRLGRADASLQDVEAALDRVGLLARKPANTKLIERGGNLSHGERQLVSFARALVRDPEILLLDEATAHVDPETEQLIERALAAMFSGRTCLIIAHRLATVRRADRIVVMDKGRIVESGTRDELIALGGLYARLEAKGDLAE
jgi:ATP-binding cassette, subfamily B, multidrug efflux pump